MSYHDHDAYPPLPTPNSITKSHSPSTRSGRMSHHSGDDLVRPADLHDKEFNNDAYQAGTGVVATAGKRRYLLLLIFSVSNFLDLCSRASAFVFVNSISEDLDIDYETSTWILNSFGVTFGSFLLLWGRVSDLYSAKMVFSLGFLFCGILSLVISFMNDQYSFYVFRGLYGVSAAATLILAVFDPKEVQLALSLFGLSGALANALGLVIGGAFGEISGGGNYQMAGWRWFFRFVCIVSTPFALVSWMLIPHIPSKIHGPRVARWKLLDFPGSFLILAALMLLNVGLTLGASRGWVTADFLVPTILSLPLAVAFFVWEYKIGDAKAILPASLWKVNNVALMSWLALGLFPIVALPLVERYQMINGESSIKASVRMLPQGLAMCSVVILISPILKKIDNMRWAIGIGYIIAAGAYILQIYGDGSTGRDYWAYYVPAFIVGSAAFAIVFLGVNITMMTAAPSSMAGVLGALFQVCLQTGSAIAFSIQSGLLTVHEGSIGNWKNVQVSWWFQVGWAAVLGASVLVFYRPRVIADQVGADAVAGGDGSEEMQLKERREGKEV